MELKRIKPIADRCANLLRPFCERIEIAGSVRREKPDCGDIEIVCIPKKITIDDPGNMFKQIEVRHPEFVKIINSLEKVKGDAEGKYTQRILPEGIKLDLFTAVVDNWGYILAIRTGAAGYSKYLAELWVKYGYKGIDGMLTKTGKPVPVKEEIDLFRLLGLEYVDPQFRMDL